jgi:hypothetical protein
MWMQLKETARELAAKRTANLDSQELTATGGNGSEAGMRSQSVTAVPERPVPVGARGSLRANTRSKATALGKTSRGLSCCSRSDMTTD